MGPGIFGSIARAIDETLSGPDSAALPDFSGRWLTSFGPMQLTQEGNHVQGDYDFRGTPCQIAGTIENGKLVFEYREPTVSGEGWFELITPGKFAGQWRPHGVESYARWEVRREFE